ncbi:dTMP kinase [Haladaptatus cibarius]|uniref:dTMP kinase n=1 Tax=Haladaptatus cibarius TaxID=453847 RepID=UPI000679A2B8|nr:deoxynucleoside kinase [Haladaptatus cibarius]
MTEKRGTLVTFEGTDGTGKSTLISRLESEFGSNVATVGEFSRSPLGDELRRLLTEDQYFEVEKNALTVVSTIVADHFYQIENEIRPLLAEGKTVLKDRYLETLQACEPPIIQKQYDFGDSAQAYIDSVETLTPIVPDLTVYLTVPREQQLRRLRERGDDIESVDERLLSGREQRYRRQVAVHSERIVTYENDGTVEHSTRELAALIREHIRESS